MTTYWANNAGGGSGFSSVSPFKISDFMALPPSPGDTLRLLADTYQGANSMIVTPLVSGVNGAPITITADVDGTVDIDGQSARDPMVVQRGCDYWSFAGFNCHSSSQSNSAVIRIRGNNGVYQRILAWDAPIGYNAHHWDMSGIALFDTGGPKNNLIEDCGGFGRGRKSFSYFQTAGPNTIRRYWGRWEWSENTGPKEILPVVYHSGGLTVDNAICEWDRSALMASSYVNLNNGSPFLTGSCAGGANSDGSTPYTAGGQCWYFKTGTGTPSTSFINEADGMVADNSAAFVAGDQHDCNNVLCGILMYVRTTDIFDCYANNNQQAAFGMTQYGNVTARDIFVYQQTGVVDTQSGRLPRGYNLTSPAAAGNSAGYGLTSICGGNASDSITNRWTITDARGGSSSGGVSKIVQGTGLSALGSGSLYDGASGANLGARLRYRYQDGVLTGTDLWPWPMSARILAATTQASTDGHGHKIANINSYIQAEFGAFPVAAANGVWFTS